MPYYYALSVLLSAFLLFQIQPMIGRFILPWFGGTPVVWSTLMLFFQALLTGGYAYAYWLMARFRSFHQGIIHLALVGLSLCIILALGVDVLESRGHGLPHSQRRPALAGNEDQLTALAFCFKLGQLVNIGVEVGEGTAEEEVGHFISLLVRWSLGLIGLTVVIIRLVDCRTS